MIERIGYSTQPRNGSTRAQRRLRAQVLAEAELCCYCHKPETRDDPFVLAHLVAHADGGPTTRANTAAAHRSCNATLGQYTPPGGRPLDDPQQADTQSVFARAGQEKPVPNPRKRLG